MIANRRARPAQADRAEREVLEPDVLGIAFLVSGARRPVRTGPHGELVRLTDQDRTRWDQELIAEGIGLLTTALPSGAVGEYQLQAAITALQVQAPDAEATDWAQIAELYGALAQLNPSPVVELNRAVAVGLADGPAAGLELLSRAGDPAGAARAYERAIALTANAVERAELERRLGALG